MSYQPKVYRTDGGDKLVVASGGTIDVQSGATFTIADGSLETPDLALAEGNVIVGNNAGKGSALNAKTTTQILVGNGTTITSVALSGDVTMTNAGVVAIAADSIINADVKTNAAIDFSKLAALDSANLLVGSSGSVATKRAITGDIGITNEGVTSITALAIVDADVNAAAAIAYSKLATLDSAYLVVGDNAGVPTKREVTGDVTISNTGVTTIGVGAVEDSMIEGLAAGQIILGVDGSAANNLKSTLSGDVSMDATGAVTIGAGAVETAMVEAKAITPAKTSGVSVLYNLGAPEVEDADRIVAATDMIVGDYTLALDPDIPRNITVTVAANDAADTMGTITVEGTNYDDAVISEVITPAAGSTIAGEKAFKTVTKVTGADWVINSGGTPTADTIEVGVGSLLGSPVRALLTTDIMLGILGVTITAHNPAIGTTLEETTVNMTAGTYNGSKDAIIFQKN